MSGWLDDWRRAARANLRAPPSFFVQGVAVDLRDLDAAGFYELWRMVLPYRFDGPFGHRILSFEECRRRGYAACADATAGAVAWAKARGQLEAAYLCIETDSGRPTYKHVRLVVDGVYVDPYDDERIVVNGCASVLPVSVLL